MKKPASSGLFHLKSIVEGVDELAPAEQEGIGNVA
jgi:hypothetical protein